MIRFLNTLRYVPLIILAGILLNACNLFEPSFMEVKRSTSPDVLVDAVLVEVNGGATTSFVYWLYLVPKGTKFEKDGESFQNPQFIADHMLDFETKWREPKLFEIHYKEARIAKFSNYWAYWDPQEPERDLKYVVELKLVPKTEGSALSEEDRRLK